MKILKKKKETEENWKAGLSCVIVLSLYNENLVGSKSKLFIFL